MEPGISAQERTHPTARRVKAARSVLLAATAVALVLSPALTTSTLAWVHRSQDDAEIARPWPGPNGTPLPFRTYDEATEFLRTALVVSSENVGIGVTGIKRLVLERDGVRAHGAFHEIDRVSRARRMNGRSFSRYYDSYKGQCAAYQMARLFELDNVPPTVCRRVNGIDGSVQLWIERTLGEAGQGAAGPPPVTADWQRQIQAMRIFDSLIFNDDRNRGNYLIDTEWALWMIDHSRAFQVHKDLRYGDEIVWCSPRMWELLQQVTDDQIRAAIDAYLVSEQMGALLERRELLVAHIQKMIDERGQGSVIF